MLFERLKAEIEKGVPFDKLASEMYYRCHVGIIGHY